MNKDIEQLYKEVENIHDTINKIVQRLDRVDGGLHDRIVDLESEVRDIKNDVSRLDTYRR
jgi:predicted  nucleic acid-binding Zn-ribbon protein